jgi:hypothetical protein
VSRLNRCTRCRKRQRSTEGWNVEMIGGMIAWYLCAECQSPQEDLEAELKWIQQQEAQKGGPLALHVDARWLERCGVSLDDGHTVMKMAKLNSFTHALVNSYPTPEIMRHKADELAAARKDKQARERVQFMRYVADGMEGGDLWEEVDD